MFLSRGRSAAPLVLATALLPFVLAGCGGNSSNTTASSGTGTVQASVTDAPGSGFDHVWVTIKGIWFHTDDTVGPNGTGWQKYTLNAPVTVDLAQLGNGAMSDIFQNVPLPAGDYRQIRLFLASTEGALTSSAAAKYTSAGTSLQYNNEVEYTSGGVVQDVPLRIPNALQGVRLDGNFSVTRGNTLRLAIDFDIGHDVVKYAIGTLPAFLLKPRLSYFDLDNAGTIAGQIDTSTLRSSTMPNGGYNVVVKAETINADGTRHRIARITTLKVDGSFVLYPLPAPKGTQTTYDVVLRGRNLQSYIVKGVPVTSGTTPSQGATQLPAITMAVDTNAEYMANFVPGSGVTPTGAWMQFLQTPSASDVPYVIRIRHLNPFTGIFQDAIPLSADALNVGNYNSQSITFAAATPTEGAGSYSAYANAPLFARTLVGTTTPANTVLQATLLPIANPTQVSQDTISGTITAMSGTFDSGFVVVSHGGLIVTTQDISTALYSGGGFQVANIPGGSASNPVSGAFYTATIYAWNSASPLASFAAAVAPLVDLRSGSITNVNLTL